MQNEQLWRGGREDTCRVVIAVLSNILEPGGQSEKSPGKEGNMGIKRSNYKSLKSFKCSVQLQKWLSVWS